MTATYNDEDSDSSDDSDSELEEDEVDVLLDDIHEATKSKKQEQSQQAGKKKHTRDRRRATVTDVGDLNIISQGDVNAWQNEIDGPIEIPTVTPRSGTYDPEDQWWQFRFGICANRAKQAAHILDNHRSCSIVSYR